ncbi:hypothetical protein TBLA_0A05300 [Henningerozyma blattae CBS 6284]|uniref:ABC transporter domain-containing protein n=1 Tax=Henningerozyma blattae (strain ATCC 34711 / CBS 6284 / DSM 70876 / NBRC 10599 / NRRL Y-10934 / UCD 77-7) TaxID=1071380 RepID=I2GW21_HENB6|nr:hypothetical protein TBLA_0A05300 [Tetrapisispora blattae CBS 6284]CCH58323.1 hypothetical protein TBLA_0A05300 [Tetrapisispora blattae CBS 6284]
MIGLRRCLIGLRPTAKIKRFPNITSHLSRSVQLSRRNISATTRNNGLSLLKNNNTKIHVGILPIRRFYSNANNSDANANSNDGTKSNSTNTKGKTREDIYNLFKLAKPEKWYIIASMGLIFITSAVSMLVPSVIGKLLDISTGIEFASNKDENDESSKEDKNENENENENKQTLIYGYTPLVFFSGLGVIFVVGAIANTGRIIILKLTGERIVARLRTRTMKNILKQDGKFQDSNKVGDLISRLSSDSSIVSNAVTRNVSDGARAVIQGCVGVGMMSFISLKLSGVMLFMVPPIGVLAMIYGRKIRNISKKLQESVGSLTKISEEQLNGTRTIQSYVGEKLEIHKYAKEVRKVYHVGLNEAVASGLFFGVTGLIGNGAMLSLLYVGCNMISNGTLSIGGLSSFMMYAVYTGSSLFGLSSFYSEIMKGSGAASRIFEINKYVPDINATKGIDPISFQDKPIEFEHIKFAYPTRSGHMIFQDLNIKINPGEHVCIIGPSGSGKSTISSLLLRYYDPLAGTISIGGKDIKEYSLRKYRKLMGVVHQEPVLFNGTILENILYNVPEEIANDKERLSNAIESSNCNKFLNTLPLGLETPVGPRGTQLSGGQKQRVALARAFLLEPTLLVLDEATSALDPRSESIVAQTLKQRCAKGFTTISIAHRVSTIKHSSRVVVLDKVGHVVETGPYEELLGIKDSALNKLLLSQNVEA